jgi:predicted chitinase
MAGLQDTRQQKLPSFADAQKIIQAHKADYALRNTETGDVMPMRLSPMSKQVREVFPKPVEEPPAQAVSGLAAAKTYTPDDYRNTYIKELRQAGYSDRAVAAMLGVGHGETGGYTQMTENARYTTPKRIAKIFPHLSGRAKEIAAMEPKDQYNTFYDGNKKIGNTQPGDGYQYRGRGDVHLTGRQGYENVDKHYNTGGLIANNPDLVGTDPVWAARSAIAFLSQPEKMGSRKDFGLKDVLPLVGGARTSWPTKKKAAKEYLAKLPTMMASNP